MPESVWERTGLQVLILADNGLTDLPDGIGRLRSLRTLDLGHNRLPSVPPAIGELTGLDGCLYLHDNALAELPGGTGEADAAAVPQHRRERSHRPAREHRTDGGPGRTPGAAQPVGRAAGHHRRPARPARTVAAGQ
ncbi:leucine-rich repeat domain-containing protein [Streptomyces sp. AM6-12]|uniref:leucine-rich repeat domain-containing protein n=1 Tax=Streptomyces sp. AM6-12 TaxID=3345149 RepID=UPI003798E579